MASVGDEIVNPRTGQRMVLRTSIPELLEIETWDQPHAVPEAEHVHPRQESGARVLSGSLRFNVRGTERTVGPGESIAIPAGAPHSFWNPGEEEEHAIGFFTPALKTFEFFKTFFTLARDGKVDEYGMPSLLQLAVMVPVFQDEIRPTKPPWPLLKATATVIGPLARLRGYRASYPHRESTARSAPVPG